MPRTLLVVVDIKGLKIRCPGGLLAFLHYCLVINFWIMFRHRKLQDVCGINHSC
ncbi:hypothetical protein OROHE_001749 [Orobanche hederae]